MILITGGSGFIGSNLVAALSERGLGPLVICDRMDSDQRQADVDAPSLWHNHARHSVGICIHKTLDQPVRPRWLSTS